MKQICHTISCKTLQNGAVLSGGSFCFPHLMIPEAILKGTNKERDEEYKPWHTGNYRAKLANASFRTARSSLAVSEKIILTAFRYFSRKPCLTGSIYRWALVVQRAAKARIFTIKIKES